MFRIESDSIGERQVPINAYYGIQSLRAKENFRISGRKVHPELILSAVEIKKGSAIANFKAGAISKEVYESIVYACDRILKGEFLDDFIVDAIQGGAGTSLNMNVNEVIANVAIEYLGGNKGDYSIVHPNDHVNCGQSTNDVYPSAGKITLIKLINKAIRELSLLSDAFSQKGKEYRNVIKMGRTEMQDAVPISFKQVFNAYSRPIERDVSRLNTAIKYLSTLNMGGTAIGTKVNAEKVYVESVVTEIANVCNLSLKQASDLVDSTQNLDVFVEVSGYIKTCATNLSKIANDLRLLSSGPRTGFSEINLPAKQNGSSIMPGKINPVIPEVINQICFKIFGNDCTVTHAVEGGQLELNAFEPVIFDSLIESLTLLTNGAKAFRTECVEGITVNEKVCLDNVLNSISIITATCPKLGYKKASSLAKKALKENKTVKQVLIEENLYSSEEADKVLDPNNMI